MRLFCVPKIVPGPEPAILGPEAPVSGPVRMVQDPKWLFWFFSDREVENSVSETFQNRPKARTGTQTGKAAGKSSGS